MPANMCVHVDIKKPRWLLYGSESPDRWKDSIRLFLLRRLSEVCDRDIYKPRPRRLVLLMAKRCDVLIHRYYSVR